MAANIVSSIIFFLLLIIFSHCVDVKAFAAQMEHRKLSGEKVTIATGKNMEGNVLEGSKIETPPSNSRTARSAGSARSPIVCFYSSETKDVQNITCEERVKNPPPPPAEVDVLPPRPSK